MLVLFTVETEGGRLRGKEEGETRHCPPPWVCTCAVQMWTLKLRITLLTRGRAVIHTQAMQLWRALR